jgi:hypothetical protein
MAALLLEAKREHELSAQLHQRKSALKRAMSAWSRAYR